MHWFQWFLLANIVIGPIIQIYMIGVERKPITKGTALISVLVSIPMALGVISFWGK